MALVASDRYLIVDSEACQLCARCLVQRACRWHAVVRFGGDEPPAIDAGLCTLCYACLDSCAYGAVVLQGRPSASGQAASPEAPGT